jgi:hypothetical protein
MEIIIHRANTISDWNKAIKNGWGIEVDIRTHCGELYFSHELIKSDEHACSLVAFAELDAMINQFSSTVVLDFKESGLIHKINNNATYACTDLIVPDQLFAKDFGVRTLSRKSKYEEINVTLGDEFWLDYVFSPDDLEKHKDVASTAYVVSPEIHNHQHNCKLKPKYQLTNEFISAVIDLGFKGVCTKSPEIYSEKISAQL